MGMLALLVFVTMGVIAFIGLALLMVALKMVFWVAFLPFRLLFGVLTLPFLLLRLILGVIAGLIGGVVLLVGAVVFVVVALATILAPLLPIAFVVLVTWAIVKLLSRPSSQIAG